MSNLEGKLKFKTWQEFLFVFPFLNGYVSKSSVGHIHPFPNSANHIAALGLRSVYTERTGAGVITEAGHRF